MVLARKRLRKLNRRGIFTVNQLSYTFRPRRKPEKVDNRSKVRSFELQALAISQQRIFMYDLPERFSDAETEIFLDVEGLPQFNFYYLIGIAVKTRTEFFYKSFWSSSKDDEQANMIEFISTISMYDNYRIYHYGSYETAFLKAIQRKLGDQYQIAINKILERCCNLLSLLYSNIYFPVYSNSLKEIAHCIDFKWSEAGATGLNAIYWREMWQNLNEDIYKEKLITYNQEDCYALAKLKKVLSNIFDNSKLDRLEVSKVRDLVSNRRASFVINSSFFPEMKYINKCAYFDYKKERVHARRRKRIAYNLVNPQDKKYFSNCKPTKVITVEANCCESCNCKRVTPIWDRHRKVVDLVFTSTGVKRVIIQYFSSEYRCNKCGTSFVPKGYPPYRLRLGHKLIVWVIFQHFENNQSF
ncbi:MAG TPA: TM0106 family RecB-like putative nuclease [Chryseolinea sp.]|nr:TM0106 family RecB-like putative nuclease [Chryseolinea sp.]